MHCFSSQLIRYCTHRSALPAETAEERKVRRDAEKKEAVSAGRKRALTRR